jgi:hypothetical protein
MSKNVKIIIIVIALVLFIIIGAVFLSHKKSQSPAVSKVPSNASISQKGNQPNINTTVENTADVPPAPTGKVDDTVNAIIDSANKEDAQATSDDNDAKSATASDAQVVDEIGQGL